MDINKLLVVVHVIGTILGVGGATFVEIFLNKSLKDGQIDSTESDFLKTTYRIVRVGLVLAILSGFGFLLLYKLNGQTARLYNPLLWAKLTMLLIILVNAVLLQIHKISLWWGSAISFVSWYAVTIVGIFLGPPQMGYFEIMLYYGVAIIVGGFILDFIRKKMSIKKQP